MALKSVLSHTTTVLERQYAQHCVYPHELCILVDRAKRQDEDESLTVSSVRAVLRHFPLFQAAAWWSSHGRGIRFEFLSVEDKDAALQSIPTTPGGDRITTVASVVSAKSTIDLHFKQCPPIDLGVRVNVSNIPSSYLALDDQGLLKFFCDLFLLDDEPNAVLSVHRIGANDRVKAQQAYVCFSSAPMRLVVQDLVNAPPKRNRPRPVFIDPAFPALQISWQWGHPHKVCPHCKFPGHIYATCPFADCPIQGSDVAPVASPLLPPRTLLTLSALSRLSSLPCLLLPASLSRSARRPPCRL